MCDSPTRLLWESQSTEPNLDGLGPLGRAAEGDMAVGPAATFPGEMTGVRHTVPSRFSRAGRRL